VLRIKSVIAATVLLALAACEQPEKFEVSHDLPEPDSAGAVVLVKYCGSCHAPPKPTAHKQGEWKNVVFRMERRRLMEAMEAMPKDEYDTLVNYLDKHAAS
jgi:hypothetical protein